MELEKNNGATLTTYAVMNALIHTVVFAILFWYLPGITEGWRYLHYYALFGFCAYGTQPLIGLLSDFCERPHRLVQTGVMLVGVGYLFPIHFASEYITVETALDIRMVLLGLGLSFFRACAGGSVLRRDEGKALPIGTFLSTSALGIALAVFLPKLGYVLLPVLLFAASAPDRCEKWALSLPVREKKTSPVLSAVIAAALLGGIFLLSFTEVRGTALFPDGKKTAVLLALVILAGRIASGLCRDLLGFVPGMIALPAGFYLLFRTSAAPAHLAGLFLLNLAIPLLYFAVSRLLPRFEGFGFGLCSAVLFPAAWIANRGGLLWNVGDEKRLSALLFAGVVIAFCSLALYVLMTSDYRFLGRKKKAEKKEAKPEETKSEESKPEEKKAEGGAEG